MGNNGSITTKARVRESLLTFTKWSTREMDGLYSRCYSALADSFSLRRNQFEYLISIELVGFVNAKDLYDNVFCINANLPRSIVRQTIEKSIKASGKTEEIMENTEDNDKESNQQRHERKEISHRLAKYFPNEDGSKPSKGIVDKFEVICVITLASKLSDSAKIEYLFDIFNFNEKGYLLRDELTLLIMSTMNGVYKADKSLLIPSSKICEMLVNHAITDYAISDSSQSSIRRPELVKFAAETLNVRGFLDAWRGHSCQVLLAENEMWRDLTFPATESSICPASLVTSKTYGLPPHDFVHWVRLQQTYPEYSNFEVNESIEAKVIKKTLFTHTTSMLKTIDRMWQYQGLGLLGKGTLRQGLLADKWILNAIAIVASQPNLFFKIFPSTGQELQGRYCCQLFEGTSWRLLFCDDRVPCAIDSIPLFSSSSDIRELCIPILEKGLAKYFGSYGHISLCSGRYHDNILMGLRLLTGGHSLEYRVQAFVWSNLSLESSLPSGLEFSQKIFYEGSIIAFGRSEELLTSKETLSISPRDRYPHGYYFPLMGMQLIKDMKYFIFKDSWGILSKKKYIHDDGYSDSITGHPNTFRIAIDEIEHYFDRIIISRYPDLLRSNDSKSGQLSNNQQTITVSSMSFLHPVRATGAGWITECIGQITEGPTNPAVFVLQVYGNKKIEIKKKNISKRKKLQDVSENLRERELNTLFDDFTSMEQKQKELENERQEKSLLEDDWKKFSPLELDLPMEMTEITFTIGSICEWIVAGSSAHQPQIKVVIVPSYETRLHLQEYFDTTNPIIQSSSSYGSPMTSTFQGNSKLSPETSTYSDHDQGEYSHSSSLYRDEDDQISENRESFEGSGSEHQIRKSYETILTANQSWISHSMDCYPGEYYIFCDVSYNLPYPQLIEMILPHENDIHQSPWLEGRSRTQHSIYLHLSSPANYTLSTKLYRDLPPHNVDLQSVSVVKSVSPPFMIESQAEVSERGLISMLTRIQEQALIVNSENYKVQEDLNKTLKQVQANYAHRRLFV